MSSCRTLKGLNGKMCKRLHTSAVVQKMQRGKNHGIGDGSGHSVLSFIASRSFFLIGKLFLDNLSETVVVVRNAPHDRPSLLVGHLSATGFLGTKPPMPRVPD